MAKEKLETDEGQAKTEQQAQSPKPQGSENQKKKNGFLFGFFAVLTAITIMLAVVGGAFYFIVHNNISGLGERYRSQLQGKPILKRALPSVPDPEDPKYIPDNEIRDKYIEMRNKKNELANQVEEIKKQIEELQQYKNNEPKLKEDAEKMKKEAEDQKAQAEKDKKAVEEQTKKLNEMIASGDKAGFKEYFEKVDKETAQKIYSDIIKDEKASEDAKKFAKLYETMDPAAAAKIFEELGNSKIDLVVETVKNMKKEVAAEILTGMDPGYAAKVTEQLSKRYGINLQKDTSKGQ